MMQDDTCEYGFRVLKKIKAMFVTIRDREKYTKREYKRHLSEHEQKILDEIRIREIAIPHAKYP